MAGAGGLEMLCSEVIAASPFGILVHDAEGKILLFNARLEEITGYTASEVPDISTWLRLISPTDEYRQIWLDEPSNDIVPGVPRVRESMITRRDGLKEICRFHSACQLSGLRIVFIQPIEKLDAQQQTEPAFREIIDMLPETVYEMDPTGRITFLNRNGYERFGVTREDIERGFYPIDMLIPEDRVRARQSLEGVLSGKYRGPNEYTAILKDGRRVSHLAHSRPIVRDGNIAGSRGLIIDTTARREIEACLRENEERLRLAVEAAQIGIYTTDLETDRRHWSAEMYAIAGQPPGSIRTDEEAWSIVHPEDRERVLDIHRRALDPAGDGNFYSEHRIVRPNGEVRWIAWRGCTYFREDSSGKVPIRRIGACIDITDRKLAENALKRSENKFSKMFNATPPGLAITTFDEGRYLEANPAECLLTGYSRDDLIGRRALELEFYEDPEDSLNIRRLLTKYGTLNNYRFRFRRKSGELRWGLISANIIEFEGEKCILSTVSDMTDLHLTEEALKVSEERLRMATEGANLGWYDWDLQTGAIACNDIFYSMLGYAPQEFPFSFEVFMNLVHAEDYPLATKLVQEAFKDKTNNYTAEYRVLQKDGTYRWIRDAGRVVERDENGFALRAVGIHIDIHNRKVAEEELFKANQELEARVKRRTASLEALNKSLQNEIASRRTVEEELRAKTVELGEINTALRVFLRKSREESDENVSKIIASIRETAIPHLEKLKLARPTGRQAAYLQLLEEALSEITSSEQFSLLDLQRKLTPTEYQVALLLRQGKTSKQLSEIMSLSCRTIESHRKNIRKKLGIQHKKANLRSHLFSVESPKKL